MAKSKKKNTEQDKIDDMDDFLEQQAYEDFYQLPMSKISKLFRKGKLGDLAVKIIMKGLPDKADDT